MKLILNLSDKLLIYLNKAYLNIYPEVIPSNVSYKNFLSNSLFFLFNLGNF